MIKQTKLELSMGRYLIIVEKLDLEEPNTEDPMNAINDTMIEFAFKEIYKFIKKTREDKAQ